MDNKGNVEVVIGDHPEDRWNPDGQKRRAAVVIDKRAGRAWTGEGWTDGEAATDAVRRFLGDRRAREYV